MTPASMYPGKTFVDDNGISSRGFRNHDAAARFSSYLLVQTQRANGCSISGGHERGQPNHFGVWVVSWREIPKRK